MEFPKNFSFVDVETTGCNSRFDRIIEIGIIRLEDNKISEVYSSLINPQMYIPLEIRQLTGITQEELEKAPLFEDVQGKILSLLDNSIFVAHNARFDYGFIKSELARFNNKFSSKTLCTVKLSRKLFPAYKAHNLDAIIERFSLTCPKRHRALDDARCLYDFITILNKTIGKDKVEDYILQLIKTPTLPQYLSKEQIDNLPEDPGVYLFYGEDKSLLYVGKSVNIKERVKSHFTSDYLSVSELKIARDVRDIQHIRTAGELGALILESQLIKEYCPIYNKHLRLSRKLIVAEKSVNEDGYNIINLHQVNANEIVNPSAILAIYRSMKKAKEELYTLVETHHLCPKLLGLEKGKGACFNSQIDKCLGACINKENYLKYNIRFIEAFSGNRIEKWPFSSCVELIEESEDKTEIHIVDNWYYLGSIRYFEDSEQPEIVHSEKIFDWDIYKILKRYLLHKKAKIKIQFPEEKHVKMILGG